MNEKANLIFFDGHCNLCNGFVNFMLKRDKKQKFKFGSLQSDKVKDILKSNGILENDLYSILYLDQGKLYDESTAVLKICRKMNGIWPILYGLIIIPKFIRDTAYRIIARNRYNWFGRREVCRIPEVGLEGRFLS